MNESACQSTIVTCGYCSRDLREDRVHRCVLRLPVVVVEPEDPLHTGVEQGLDRRLHSVRESVLRIVVADLDDDGRPDLVSQPLHGVDEVRRSPTLVRTTLAGQAAADRDLQVHVRETLFEDRERSLVPLDRSQDGVADHRDPARLGRGSGRARGERHQRAEQAQECEGRPHMRSL